MVIKIYMNRISDLNVINAQQDSMYTTLPFLYMLRADTFGAAFPPPAFAAAAVDSADANWAGVGGGGGNFGATATTYMLAKSIFHISRWNAYKALQLVQGMQVDLLQELQHPVSSIFSVLGSLNHVFLLTTTSWRCCNKSA